MSSDDHPCLICFLAMSDDTATWCDTCLQYICATCFALHPCLASKFDFSDSVPNSAANSPRESVEGAQCTVDKPACSNGAMEHLTSAGDAFTEFDTQVYVRCENFDVLSLVRICTDSGVWHAFGQTLADFQTLCECASWDLPEGLLVLNSDIGKALVFQSGRVASQIGVWNSIHYMRSRGSIGIIMRRAEGGWNSFYLVEVHRYRGLYISPHPPSMALAENPT